MIMIMIMIRTCRSVT